MSASIHAAALAVLSIALACSSTSEGPTMTPQNGFLPAEEIRRIAGATASKALPDEVAETLPVPVRDNGRVVLLILYYLETGPAGRRTVHPPTHAMHIDPASGRILRFWRGVPEDLGIRRLDPVPGAGIAPGMSVGELIEREDRVLELSPRVWEAFSTGDESPPAEVRTMLRQYLDDFLAITKTEVAPFYVGAAPEFFSWLSAAAAPRP